jgi:hypothetical protein
LCVVAARRSGACLLVRTAWPYGSQDSTAVADNRTSNTTAFINKVLKYIDRDGLSQICLLRHAGRKKQKLEFSTASTRRNNTLFMLANVPNAVAVLSVWTWVLSEYITALDLCGTYRSHFILLAVFCDSHKIAGFSPYALYVRM